MRYFLPKTGLKAIDKAVEALFNRLKARFLGQKKEPKQIRFGVYDQPVKVREDFSMPGIFEEAARSEGVKPNEQLKNSLNSSIEAYLDAHQELAKAKVKTAVQTFLTESEMSKKKPDVEKMLGKQLGDVFTKVNSDVQAVVDNEMNKAKNVSTLDGIIKRGLSFGIEDPTVVFIGPMDSYTCEECKRLYFLPDMVTPRAWKVSELKHGYGKRGDETPSIGGMHPHCFTGNMRLYCDLGVVPLSELVNKGKLGLTVDKRVKARQLPNSQHKKAAGEPYLDRHASGAKVLDSTDAGVYSTGDRPCLRITLSTGHMVEVSTEHEMWVDDGKSGVKVKACDIKIGDKIPVLSGEGVFGKDHFPIEAELMGNLIGDGFLDQKKGVASWGFFGTDIPYGQELFRKACSLEAGKGLRGSGDGRVFTIHPPDNIKYKVERGGFNSSVLGRFFIKEFGLSKSPARVPVRLWGADKETVAAFIRGFMAADGTMNSYSSVSLGQVNKEILNEVQLLLSNFGIMSSVTAGEAPKLSVFPNVKGGVRICKSQQMWKLLFGGLKHLSIFQREIGFGVPCKNEKLAKSVAEAKLKREKGCWRTSRVVSIEDIGVQPTYCVTEPTLNTVTVNGIVTGQCRHSMCPMMPGYGFKAGKIAYIEPGYDVWKDQRS